MHQRRYSRALLHVVAEIVFFFLLAGCGYGVQFTASSFSSWTSLVSVFRNSSVDPTSGFLQMNSYTPSIVGRALYRNPVHLLNSSSHSLASFNTSFSFSMNTSRGIDFYGDGLTFLICPTFGIDPDSAVSSGGYLGLFNASNNGLASNRVIAVEFDTHLNPPFRDPNDNHVGVDINSLRSVVTYNLTRLGIDLNGGRRIYSWIDYDGSAKWLWVFVASTGSKPVRSVIAMPLDMSLYILDNMYVGFTASTGTRAELHTIYSWTFSSGFVTSTSLSSQPPPPPSSPSPPPSRPSPPPPLPISSGLVSAVTKEGSRLSLLRSRTAIVAVFALSGILVALCFMIILARRSYRRRSKYWVNLFLPLVCWIYWKETSDPPDERSARCLKLTVPSVELLAWLWRWKLARQHHQKGSNERVGNCQGLRLGQTASKPRQQEHCKDVNKATPTTNIESEQSEGSQPQKLSIDHQSNVGSWTQGGQVVHQNQNQIQPPARGNLPAQGVPDAAAKTATSQEHPKVGTGLLSAQSKHKQSSPKEGRGMPSANSKQKPDINKSNGNTSREVSEPDSLTTKSDTLQTAPDNTVAKTVPRDMGADAISSKQAQSVIPSQGTAISGIPEAHQSSDVDAGKSHVTHSWLFDT